MKTRLLDAIAYVTVAFALLVSMQTRYALSEFDSHAAWKKSTDTQVTANTKKLETMSSDVETIVSKLDALNAKFDAATPGDVLNAVKAMHAELKESRNGKRS